MLTEKRTLQFFRRRLPAPVRYGLQALYGLIPAEIHLGPEYRRWRTLIAGSEFWSDEEHRCFQMRELVLLLRHCFDHVPYYRNLSRRLGLRPEDFTQVGDLSRLPVLSKDMIRDHLEEFVARNFPRRRLRYTTTGGSTGLPLGFYNDPRVLPREAAFAGHIWGEHGFRPWKDRCAVLRGVFVQGPRGEFWSYNPFRKELHLSSNALTADNARAYLEQVAARGIRFLQAFPSAAGLWAQYLEETGGASGVFRVIFTASETLYPRQRRHIERIFGCPVVDFYGQSEHVAMARTCEGSSTYHFFPQYGVVEFLEPSSGQPAAPGRIAEIVATGFLNRATPMIRYRTGDLGVVAGGTCPCGRRYPSAVRIEGRLQELLLTPDGRRVSMAALNMHNDLFDRVRRFQFEQTEPASVLLRVVPKPDYSERDTVRIAREIGEKIGPTVRLRIETADRIEPGPGGKHRWLIQRLPMPVPEEEK